MKLRNMSLLIPFVFLFAGACTQDDLLPNRPKEFHDATGYPASGIEQSITVAGAASGLTIVAADGSATTVGATTHYNGPVFVKSGTNVSLIRGADLVRQADGTLAGLATLPDFAAGTWKNMTWTAGTGLFPCEVVPGSAFFDPAGEHLLQGGVTNRLPIIASRTYLLYKIDLSLAGLTAIIPGNPLRMFAEKAPLPGLQIYYIVDPDDPSYFLSFNAKNFAKIEKRFADSAAKNGTKPKLRGIGKLDLLDGFGIGLSSRGIMPFNMDYTNLLDAALGVRYTFGSHLWLAAKIPFTAYGLPFILDGNAACNFNPDDLPAISLGASDLRFRLGVNGKLFFDLEKYIAGLGASGVSKKKLAILGALASLVKIGELGGASTVVEISANPSLYFSTYSGNPAVTLDLGFLSKVPGLEGLAPDIQSAVNGMLTPDQSTRTRFAGFFRAGNTFLDPSWFIGYHATFKLGLGKVLGYYAAIGDALFGMDSSSSPISAEGRLEIGSETGIRLNGKLTGGLALFRNFSLNAGAEIDLVVKSHKEFSFSARGGMGLDIFGVGATLDGEISVANSRVYLAGLMSFRLGPAGSIDGRLSGTFIPSVGQWSLAGSGTFSLLGYRIAGASISTTESGLWVEGTMQIPGFSGVAMRGTVNFRTGEISVSGKADITIKGFTIANATVTLGTYGVSFAGTLNVPHLSSIAISGRVDKDGHFSITARATLALLGYKISDAYVSFSDSGFFIEGLLSIPGISSIRIGGSIGPTGQIAISGNTEITVAGYKFANAFFKFSNDGFRISSDINLLGFMSLTVGGLISTTGSFDISGDWHASTGHIGFGIGWVEANAGIRASLGTDGFSFEGSVGVSFSLGYWPFEYSDDFTISSGIIIDDRGVGFSCHFPLIGRKTIWVYEPDRSRVAEGYALPEPDNKRAFAVRAPAN